MASARKKEGLNKDDITPPRERVEPGIEGFSLLHQLKAGQGETESCADHKESADRPLGS